MLLRKNRKHWTKCALRRNFVTLCSTLLYMYPLCAADEHVSAFLSVDWCARDALDDVARTVPQRCPPPLSPSSPSCRCVSGPARQLARAAARSPRASLRFSDATRVWTPPSASLTAIPPAPAVVPAGDAPVRVPGQHLHAEGRRRAREGGHHRAEYVPSHRLETHRDRRASFSAIDRVIGFWCPPKRRDTVWLFSLAKTETRVRAFSRDKRRKR